MALQGLGDRQRCKPPRLDRDVDDTAFARLVQVGDDRRARNAHHLGDIILRHPFLVIEPARPDVGVVAEAQRCPSTGLNRRQARPRAAARPALAVHHRNHLPRRLRASETKIDGICRACRASSLTIRTKTSRPRRQATCCARGAKLRRPGSKSFRCLVPTLISSCAREPPNGRSPRHWPPTGLLDRSPRRAMYRRSPWPVPSR